MSSGSFCKMSDLGKIVHLSEFSEHLAALFLEQVHSDITLIVDGQKLVAHKVILATRSEYFRALLYGGFKETNQTEIELLDVPLEAFKVLLKYIYTGVLDLSMVKEEILYDTLGLAHQYGFESLESAISENMAVTLELTNVCAIMEIALLYGLTELVKVGYQFIDKNASHVLRQPTFLQLSQETLIELLKRDSFFASEVDIFRGVCEWCRVNEDKDNLALEYVRLPLISVPDLMTVVRPAGFVKVDTLIDAIVTQKNTSSAILPHRGQLLLDINVATIEENAEVVSGELSDNLLDTSTCYYCDMESKYTIHAINGPGDQGIIIKLGTPFIINHIKMLLWDKDSRSYSYFIEISMDQKDWLRVIDYSQYSCRSWQYLYFEGKAVQYIRIVGTHSTVDKVFQLMGIEAKYTENFPKLLNDIIVPNYQVATLEKEAVVIEGESLWRNDLLMDIRVQEYDSDYGHTSHQIGSGSIIVQLGQPYIVSSLRLLLLDCDDRSYSYYIESSTNLREWEKVVDHTRDRCSSWQDIEFLPRPIVFIKIVGTQSTVNKIFHCIHLECPSMKVIEEQILLALQSRVTDGRGCSGRRCGRGRSSPFVNWLS